jgi:hypothetical protein
MPTMKREKIIGQTIQSLHLSPPAEPVDWIEAIDTNGKAFHIKYRTEGRLSSLSFDFKPGELDAPYDFFIGLLITENGEISTAFCMKRSDVNDMAVQNADSRRLRWNDKTRRDPRVKPLNL